MPKAKTKTIGWNTVCTEELPGRWYWECEGVQFWSEPTTRGINTGVISKDNHEHPMVYFADLKSAVLFSYGVVAGFNNTLRDVVKGN